VKIHLDTGDGTTINWEPAELTATIGSRERRPAGRSRCTA
jgi:hypothetical protein